MCCMRSAGRAHLHPIEAALGPAARNRSGIRSLLPHAGALARRQSRAPSRHSGLIEAPAAADLGAPTIIHRCFLMVASRRFDSRLSRRNRRIWKRRHGPRIRLGQRCAGLQYNRRSRLLCRSIRCAPSGMQDNRRDLQALQLSPRNSCGRRSQPRSSRCVRPSRPKRTPRAPEWRSQDTRTHASFFSSIPGFRTRMGVEHVSPTGIDRRPRRSPAKAATVTMGRVQTVGAPALPPLATIARRPILSIWIVFAEFRPPRE